MKISNKMQYAFTIVELLVVIVIIGILATLALVSYSGINVKAITVSLMSDLDSGNKLLKMYDVEHGYYPSTIGTDYCPDTPTPDNRYCLKASTGNELDYTGSGQTFTLTATNTGTGISYQITEGGTIIAINDGSGGGGGGGSSAKTFANTWGGAGFDQIASMIYLPDGSFIVAGGTDSYGSGGQDVYLAKYSSEGVLVWDKTWGGAAEDDVNAMISTSDGGFAIAGNTSSFGVGQGDAYVSKFTSDGTLSWTRTWGGAQIDYATAIIQNSDDDYIIVGNTGSFGTAGDAFIVKFASNGSFAWNKTWGGALNDRPEAIIQTSDDGYVVAGVTYSFGVALGNSYIAKYTSDGTLSWDKTWGGAALDKITSMIKLPGDAFIVAGHTASSGSGGTDAYFAKYGSDGALSWDKTWGGSGDDYIESIIGTSDGGFAVVGESDSFGAGLLDSYIAKFSADGTESWSKTFGGGMDDIAMSIAQTSDNGYVVGGYTSSFGSGSADSFVARYKSTGLMDNCSAGKCQSITASTSDPSASEADPSATVNTPSATVNPQTALETNPNATITIVVPIDPWPAPTISFSSQELYIAYPGDDMSQCKQWTVPDGKQIHGFYVNHATEAEYDFFVVSLDGNEKYNKSGLVSDEYVDVSSTPGTVLNACVTADSSTQDGFGGEVTGVYYK